MEYKYDVIFTGSYNYHPEFQYRRQLIDWLNQSYGDKFRRFAGDVQPEGTVRGDRLNRLYASSKVVVGDTLCPNFTKKYYTSDRLFEVTGRGGFLIYPYIYGLEDFFQIGKEIVTYKYGDFHELKEKIDYYLEHEAERESIRLAGHNRTKNNHTYTHRLSKIISILENEC